MILLGLLWGASEYVLGFEYRVLIGRLLIIPYIYIGIAISIILLYWLPKKLRSKSMVSVGWGAMAVIAIAIQLAWIPVLNYYKEATAQKWENELQLGKDIAAVYDEGAIAVPAGRPGMTYVLAHHHGISGDKFVSQMYDPFAYSTAPDPFDEWSEFRVEIADWLKRLDIRMLIFPEENLTYMKMTQLEPQVFQHLGSSGSMQFYRVWLPEG